MICHYINIWTVTVLTSTPSQSLSTWLSCMESSTSISAQKVGGRDFQGYPSHKRYLKVSGNESRPCGRLTDLIPLWSRKASNLRFTIFSNALGLKFICVYSVASKNMASIISDPWRKIISVSTFVVTCNLYKKCMPRKAGKYHSLTLLFFNTSKTSLGSHNLLRCPGFF